MSPVKCSYSVGSRDSEEGDTLTGQTGLSPTLEIRRSGPVVRSSGVSISTLNKTDSLSVLIQFLPPF